MYLYQAFNLRVQLISIFQRLSQIYTECVLITLKIKSKTLDRMYFMSQVFQEHSHCYNKKEKKNKKMKTTKTYLFLLPPLPFQDVGLLQFPHPPTFSTAKIFEKIFHRYMGIWTKGG